MTLKCFFMIIVKIPVEALDEFKVKSFQCKSSSLWLNLLNVCYYSSESALVPEIQTGSFLQHTLDMGHHLIAIRELTGCLHYRCS